MIGWIALIVGALVAAGGSVHRAATAVVDAVAGAGSVAAESAAAGSARDARPDGGGSEDQGDGGDGGDPAEVAYRVPVADVATASWAATHAGYPATDVFAPCGATIVAPATGTVIEIRRVDAWDPAVDDPATRGGRTISILGDDGVRYYLAHLDTIDPELTVGDLVDAGRELATMGSSGRSSACHLHLGFSPPCPETEWAVRRGVVWPGPYLDRWRRGEQIGPADEIADWVADHPDACADAAAGG